MSSLHSSQPASFIGGENKRHTMAQSQRPHRLCFLPSGANSSYCQMETIPRIFIPERFLLRAVHLNRSGIKNLGSVFKLEKE